MKKLSVVWIGIVIVVISIFGEVALSVVQEDEWSNYIHNWEIKWTPPVKYNQTKQRIAENKIAICNSRLLTNKN